MEDDEENTEQSPAAPETENSPQNLEKSDQDLKFLLYPSCDTLCDTPPQKTLDFCMIRGGAGAS